MITNDQYNNKVIYMIADAKTAFSTQQNITQVCEHVYLFETVIDNENYKIFGVEKNKQAELDYPKLRQVIFEHLQIDSGAIVEVIGDSNKFNAKGSKQAKQHFAQQMAQFNGILLYGYTGQEDIQQGLVDVNGMVNNYIARNPEFAKQVLANIVDLHTRVALGAANQSVATIPEYTGWGTTGSLLVRNFLLVWDSCGPGALFGDDILVSDGLVNSKLLLYGGGLQAFTQASNVLNYGYQVVGLAGLRGKDNPASFMKGPGYNRHVELFETALFFNKIKELTTAATAKTIVALKDSYVCSDPKPELTETRALLVNPFRANLEPILASWHKDWQNFMQAETWRKIKSDLYIVDKELIIDFTENNGDIVGDCGNEPVLTQFKSLLPQASPAQGNLLAEDINKKKAKFCVIL